MSSTAETTQMSDSDRKAKVEEFIKLRKDGSTVEEAARKVDIARDTIYKWSHKYGLGDLRSHVVSKKKTSTPKARIRNRAKPKLTTINYLDSPKLNAAPQHAAPQQAASTKKTGKVVVIIGDSQSVRDTLLSTFGSLD